MKNFMGTLPEINSSSAPETLDFFHDDFPFRARPFCQVRAVSFGECTPPKINLEPENDGLEDDFPFPGVYSQVPC